MGTYNPANTFDSQRSCIRSAQFLIIDYDIACYRNVFYHARTVAKQPFIQNGIIAPLTCFVDIQAFNSMTITIKCTGKSMACIVTDGGPVYLSGTAFIRRMTHSGQINVVCQHDFTVRKVYGPDILRRTILCRFLRLTVHQLCQAEQLCLVANGELLGSFIFRIPLDIRLGSYRSSTFDLQRVDLIGRLLGGLLVLVFLVLLIPIGIFLALVILGGLVGVVTVALTGVLVLVTSVGGLLLVRAVLGVLIHVVFTLVVPAGVGVSLVRVALDDGRAAAVHHLRGKRRGGHQRQREHHAHQQAHHAPGHVACPFLHVICSSHC